MFGWASPVPPYVRLKSANAQRSQIIPRENIHRASKKLNDKKHSKMRINPGNVFHDGVIYYLLVKEMKLDTELATSFLDRYINVICIKL